MKCESCDLPQLIGIHTNRWHQVELQCKRLWKHLLLWKLKSFNVIKDILTAVHSLSQSSTASKTTAGTAQTSLSDLYTQAVRRTGTLITQDPSHPLHNSFQLFPSGHCYKNPFFKFYSIQKKSFIPTAISMINKLWRNKYSNICTYLYFIAKLLLTLCKYICIYLYFF